LSETFKSRAESFDLDSRHRTGTERLLESSRVIDTRFAVDDGPCNIGDLARL
jgi:hypothetical protein